MLCVEGEEEEKTVCERERERERRVSERKCKCKCYCLLLSFGFSFLFQSVQFVLSCPYQIFQVKILKYPFLCFSFPRLEQLHQLVQNFFHFAPLKPTFSILHTHFYKTPTSVYLFYTFIQ